MQGLLELKLGKIKPSELGGMTHRKNWATFVCEPVDRFQLIYHECPRRRKEMAQPFERPLSYKSPLDQGK
jgi:hypothetical protein